MKRLYPMQYVDSIFKIEEDKLYEKGIRGLIFDIDNTLVPYDVAEPTEEIIDFFKSLKQKGFQISLVSNNTADRVMRFNKNLKVFAFHKSNKPGTKTIKRAIHMMGLTKEQVAIVGDQIFTDVYGGNKAGVHTILVVPVSDKDEWITKVKRGIERQVITRYEKYVEKHNG